MPIDQDPLPEPQSSLPGGEFEKVPHSGLPFTRLGHYEVVARIGQGGMGDVYRGYERALDRTVAIKVLPAELARNADFVRRFKAEAAAAAKLIHPNIIKIHFIGEEAGHHFFVMQYVEGESLADRLGRQKKVSVEETLEVAEQVLAGLAAAHKEGMVHRDIKPGNILLETVSRRVLLADFGLAKSLGSSVTGKTATGTIQGSADYLAPEQGRGQAVDGRSDLYAVGVVLYQILSGSLPFTADNPMAMIFQHVHEPPPPLSQIAPEIPTALASIVHKLLSKAPADRFQNAEAVLADLLAFRSGQPVPVQVPLPTTIVRLPAFDEIPPLVPAELIALTAPGWWERMVDRAFSLFRRHAPEVLQQLQNTEQQVDGAVAEYERRQRDLRRLAQEAESVLTELQRQAAAQRAAALAARPKAAAAQNPQAGVLASEEPAACDAAAAELEAQVADQKQQLEPIQVRLAQVQARVQELRNQRDILKARLEVASARDRMATGTGRRWRRSAVLAGFGAAVASGVLAVIWSPWKRNEVVDPKRASQQIVATGIDSQTTGTALLRTDSEPKPLFETKSNGADVVAVRYAGDGQVVTAGRADGTVEVLNAESGNLLKTFETSGNFSAGFATSPDGQVFAAVVPAGSSAGKLQFWNWRDSDAGTTVADLSSAARPLAISESGLVLVLVSDGSSNELVRWKLESRDELDRTPLAEGELGACAVRPAGDWVALVRNQAEVIVGHRPEDGNDMIFQTLATSGTALAFHPVRRWLAVGGNDAAVSLWDLDQSQPVAILQDQGTVVRGLTFDSKGRRLAVVTENDVRVWDLGLDYVRIACPVADARDAAFREDGTALAIGCRQGGVQVWNTTFQLLEVDFEQWLKILAAPENVANFEKSIRSRLPIGMPYDPRMAVTDDGRLRVRSPSAAAGGEIQETPGGDAIPRLEDARTAEFLVRYGQERQNCIAVSPNARFVATGYFGQNRQGLIRLWDLRSGDERRSLEGQPSGVTSVAFSPDGSRLLSGGQSMIHLWDVATAREIERLPVNIHQIEHVSFSRDGRLGVASYGEHGGLERHILVDLDIGEQLLQFHRPYPEIAFTPRDVLCDVRFGTLKRLGAPPSGTSTGPGAPAASPPAAVKKVSRNISEFTRIAIEAARRDLDAYGAGPQFHYDLQRIAPTLPEAQVTTGNDPPKWNAIVLNGAGFQIDAFRFRSPLAAPADLHWIFALPAGLGQWYICPVEGQMGGFESFDTDFDLELPGADLPRGNIVVFQTLLGGQIQPGREYIIWHAPVENSQEEVKFAIRLSPPGTYGNQRTIAAVAKAVGVEVKRQVVEQSPEGLRGALRTARTMVQTGRGATDEMHRVLQSERELLPEVQVSGQNEELRWNHITPTESFLFHAVRFKSPLAEPADAHMVVVAPQDLPQWRISPLEAIASDSSQSKLEVNVNFPGVALPAENSAAFQSLPGGKIEPGREYILWFSVVRGALPDMDLAIRFSPAGTFPETTDAHQIATAMGLPLAEVPSPERVTAAFRRCRRLFDNGQQHSVDFLRLLEFTIPALPTLNLCGDRGEWNKLELDTAQVQFHAFRFASTLDDVADLYSVFGKSLSAKTAWGFVSLNPRLLHEPFRLQYRDAQFDGADLPEPNLCLFDVVRGGHFRPKDSGVLFFAPEKSEELTVHVAVRLTASSEKVPEPGSPRAAAAILGLNLRAPPATPGSRLLEGHGDAVIGVSFSADGSVLASASNDGTVKLWNPATGEVQKTLTCVKTGVRAFNLSNDGLRFATSDWGLHDVVAWNTTTAEPIATVTMKGRVDSFALSADGKWLAVCDSGLGEAGQVRPGIITVRNLETGKETELIRTVDTIFQRVAWTPDAGTLIASGARNDPNGDEGRNYRGVIRFVDRTSGKVLREITDDMAFWAHVVPSSDGRRLVGGKTDCLLRVWDLPSGKEIASVAQETSQVRLNISPDGKLIATGNDDGTIRIWDAETLRIRRVLRGHAPEVLALGFSPDGQSLASGGRDASVRIWDLKNADPEADKAEHREPITNTIGMKLVPIPAGEFMMGTPDAYRLPEGYERDIASERPQHRVRLKRPYFLGAHEVTVKQFRAFVEATKYKTTAETNSKGGAHMLDVGRDFEERREFTWRSPGYEHSDDHPVGQVSWHDAVAFCEWLSKKEGVRYRLPTEAEWEYACRAGSATIWCFGNNPNFLKWCGNYADRGLIKFYGRYPTADSESDGFTFPAPVGSYLPNAFGLYDMHGNVWEWCADWFQHTYYSSSEEVDPQGPKAGATRVHRSASCYFHYAETRSSLRDSSSPDLIQSHLGFRVVREMGATD